MSARLEDTAMLERPVTHEHQADVPEERPPSVMVPDESASTTTGHPSGLTIIASKIAPVSAGRSVMHRPRLVDWFEQQRRARLILVSAEAGYGKSTLLTDYAQRSSTMCVWYRIETSDGDWITFLSYMVATLREVDSAFGRATEALLRHVAAMGSSREVVLAQFLADLGTLDGFGLDVILDDYHLVEGSDDVRMVVSRLLERAPEGMRFILAGRGRPNLALGRMLSQARVAELTIDDLRFTRAEIDELFSTTFQQPLGADDCEVIADRTEGWAASLRLVSASIAVSRPSEVGAFIKALSGATGPIYEFLADEVLTRLSEQNQRVLVHASLIDHVRPDLVSAALSVTTDPPSTEVVRDALGQAEALGLLGDRDGSGANRIHPLFRQFLAHHLEIAAPPAALRSMHVAIAAAAEPSDWLVAAKHYALGAEPDDAMRVLGSAASEALGTGAWGAAVEIIDLMPDTAAPPSVEVIRARALVSEGRTTEALERLAELEQGHLTPEERGLTGLTTATAHHQLGGSGEVARRVRLIVSDTEVPSRLRDVALSWNEMLRANHGGCISDVVERLRVLSISQESSGLHYFAGVTLHNAANAELARGRFQDAFDLGHRAVQQLRLANDVMGVIASTHSVIAASLAELGDVAGGLETAYSAAVGRGATADAIAEAAYLHSVEGEPERAMALLARFDRGDARGSRELSSRAQACYARVSVLLGQGDLRGARTVVTSLPQVEAADVDAPSRVAMIAAHLAVVDRASDAHELSLRAVDIAAAQNAWRWLARARVLEAISRRDAGQLALWVNEAATESALALPELADALASAVDLLMPVPASLERSILQLPKRWVSALGRQARRSDSEAADAAAVLVARFGTAEDAEVLRAYDTGRRRKGQRRGLATQLIRRVSPTVRVHDLGPTSYDIGARNVPLTDTRRKSAALLLYLVTRAELIAAREQVMDALWPDQSPKSALNSLHQTLFFLRRDIEPYYEDGCTADYIRMESDMVFLDRDLFQVDSVAFHRQASDILTTGRARDRGPELLRLYRGSFAPEFEYEEWAEEWRSHLHATYLHLARSTAMALIDQRKYGAAAECLSHVITVDPMALELRGTLVGCLAVTGSRDAALAHYRAISAVHTRELGEPATSFEDLLRSVSPMD